MSARRRVIALTAAAAVAAAAGAVAVGALQGERPDQVGAAAAPEVPDGPPPLTLDLGVRVDREARSLREALRLYSAGKRTQAATAFARGHSLEAQVGSAFAAWPHGTLARMNQLAGLHPQSALVQLHLGIAETWSGAGGARDAWQAAAKAEPNTAYAIVAGNLLHPSFAPGIPVFVPSTPLPRGLAELTPPQQLALLERNATSVDGRLLLGSALQRLQRPESAEQQFRAAAREAPDDVEAQVAAAVGAFDKAAPADSFSRLGPLSAKFPKSASVRFHLGLLLLWSGEVKEAKRQLGLARAAEPGSPLAEQAQRYLDELRAAGV